jgi:molecular chaperone GrpE
MTNEPAEHLPPQEPTAANTLAAETPDLQAELDKTREQMLRALADMENLRKRSQKEREDASRYAVTSFARDLLDVADNLRRALDSAPVDLPDSDPRIFNLLEGIKATERGMLSALEKNGIRKIFPLDEPFNPNFHEVMLETPAPGKPSGTVVMVMESGYMLHDRLLRPARVAVAKNDGQSGETPPLTPGGTIDTSA